MSSVVLDVGKIKGSKKSGWLVLVWTGRMSESFACDNPAAAAAALGFRESVVHRGLSAVHGVHDEAGHFSPAQ